PARSLSLAGEPSKGMPDAEHFDEVIEYVEADRLIPVLGSSPYDDEPQTPACRRAPDRAELATALATRFRLPAGCTDLARIAQHITATRGPADLNHALAELLVRDDAAPAPVHRCLARLPSLLRDRGSESYQVILTTSYDTTLEQAFDEAGEPF